MANKKKRIQEDQLTGFKYHKQITSLLDSLHDAQCERDKASNRKLHMDQYVSLILLYMFNPICTSLRAIQQCSELKKVQRKLGCQSASLGSLSDASHVFDSSLMTEIIDKLAIKLKPLATDSKLDDINEMIVAVDGSNIKALARMTWAIYKPELNAIKVHTQFDIKNHVPIKMKVTHANGNEMDELASDLEPGRIYVKDRGYAKFELFNQIMDINSSFVCRVRDNSTYEILEERALSEDAIEAKVVFDYKVNLGQKKDCLKRPIRLISIKCNPNANRHARSDKGPHQSETLLIATDRFDLEPEVISLMYKHRWAIEIFFRFFKHVLGCRHLLSDNINGIEIQMYSAIIACMLIALWTGKKPTLRTYEMVCYYFCGMADLEELTKHINKLQISKEATVE